MTEDFVVSICILLAPLVGLILILLDMPSNRSTDKTHQNLLMFAMIFTAFGIISEIGYEVVRGWDTDYSVAISWILNSAYFIFQVTAFGFTVFFLDYSIHREQKRLRPLVKIVVFVFIVNFVALAVNIFFGFMFSISSDSQYVRGDFYFVRLFISYSYVVISFVDLAISRKQADKTLHMLVFVSVLPGLIGSILDMLIPHGRFIWPCLFLSLLFGYLFIVRSNAMIDSLTGVFNRRACDEYLISLRPTRRKDYAFIMIDMDRFKEINDNFGHTKGDDALRSVADILRASVRRTDFVSRYGGDEFVVIAETGELDIIIDHINKGIEDFNVSGSQPFRLALSHGSGVYKTDDKRTPIEFLSYVDGLMYGTKTERRRDDTDYQNSENQ